MFLRRRGYISLQKLRSLMGVDKLKGLCYLFNSVRIDFTWHYLFFNHIFIIYTNYLLGNSWCWALQIAQGVSFLRMCHMIDEKHPSNQGFVGFLENKNTPLWAAVDVLSPTLHQRNYPIKVTPLQRLYYKSQHKLVCGSNTVLFSGFKKLTKEFIS